MTLYHLSAYPLGDCVVLCPRRPRDPLPTENRTVRRVSVAPTIAGCLRALRTTYYNRGLWYVYRITVPTATLAVPIAVPDAADTGEMWILYPVEARYAGRVAQTL